MGEAKRRGTYAERKIQAINAGRVKMKRTKPPKLFTQPTLNQKIARSLKGMKVPAPKGKQDAGRGFKRQKV